MSFEVEGKLLKIFDTQQVTGTFQKREFVLTVDGAYPQTVIFQLVQDKCSILDDYANGDEVKIFFDLRGREWKSPQGEIKYFNSLNAWKIEKVVEEVAETTVPSPPSSENDSFPTDAPPLSDMEDDDLPF